jgi:riboflavin biosynthesis pyrimidine reductase
MTSPAGPGSFAAGVAFDVLLDETGLPRFDLPDELRAVYGEFGLRSPVVVANFVSSVDGAVALPGVAKSSPLISAGQPADRFVMALLRATADAVVIGAGTYRAHRGPWTAATVGRDFAAPFDELRERIGASRPEPTFVIVTRSGNLGEPRPILDGALVVCPSVNSSRLGPYRAAGAEVVAVHEDPVGGRTVVDLLSERGCSRILTEGGPELMGSWLQAGVVDELFLTVSPLLFGGGDPAPVTVAGSVSFREHPLRAERLLSVRRSGDYLFLRYALQGEQDTRRSERGGAA